MRLTSKLEDNWYCVDFVKSEEETYRNAINKLGQLEDVLEKYDMDNIKKLSVHLELLRKLTNIKNDLGIDLVTLFKALRSGIHIIDDGYPYNDRVDLIYSSSTPCGFKGKISDHCVFFKDYGQTWTLTKEELL